MKWNLGGEPMETLQLTITLDGIETALLRQTARRELRHPRDQARYLLRLALGLVEEEENPFHDDSIGAAAEPAARAERPARPATARKSEFVGIRMSKDEFDTVMAVAAAAGEPGNISAGVRAAIDGAALALLGDGATPVQEHDDSPQQTTDAERDAASPLVPAPRLEKRIYSPERIARATEARMAKRAARLAAESPTPADMVRANAHNGAVES